MTSTGAAAELATGGYLSKARYIVLQQINGKADPTSIASIKDLFVISCSKTLQNWKVLIGSHRQPGLLYEVTYNGDKSESYVDVYAKLHNTVVPD